MLDLVWLATSAMLASRRDQLSLKEICTNVLDGYQRGRETPEAFILDREHMWMRTRFVVDEDERAKFWQKIESQYQDVKAKKERSAAASRLAQAFCNGAAGTDTLAYWPRSWNRQSRPRGWPTAFGAMDRCRAKARRWSRPAGRARGGPAIAPTTLPTAVIASRSWYQATETSGAAFVAEQSENRPRRANLLHADLLGPWAAILPPHIWPARPAGRRAQGSGNTQTACVSGQCRERG